MGHHLWWNVMQPQTRATVQQIYSACFMSLMQNRTIPLLHAGKLLIVRELVLLFFKKKYYYLFNIFSWVSQETTEIELWVRIKRRGSNLSFFLFLFFFLFQQKKKKKPDKHKLVMALDTVWPCDHSRFATFWTLKSKSNFCRRWYFWVKPMELLEWAVCIPIEQFWQDIYLFTKVCYFKYYKSTFSNQCIGGPVGPMD